MFTLQIPATESFLSDNAQIMVILTKVVLLALVCVKDLHAILSLNQLPVVPSTIDILLGPLPTKESHRTWIWVPDRKSSHSESAAHVNDLSELYQECMVTFCNSTCMDKFFNSTFAGLHLLVSALDR